MISLCILFEYSCFLCLLFHRFRLVSVGMSGGDSGEKCLGGRLVIVLQYIDSGGFLVHKRSLIPGDSYPTLTNSVKLHA